MKNFNYESPTVEVVDVRVEGGFNLSNYANGGITVYDVVTEGDMDSVDSY